MLGAGKISQALYHGCFVGSHGAAVLLKNGTEGCSYGKDLFPRIMHFPYFPQIMHFPYFPQITQIGAQITRIYLRIERTQSGKRGRLSFHPVGVQAATIKLYMAASLRADPRWSSSGHDNAIYGSEFAGRLDFNQPTEGGITRSDALLEVQSAQT